MDELMTADAGLSFLALTAMEIVLGIDNIVFLTIMTGRLPHEDRARARRLGLTLALVMRLLLLLTLTWVMRWTGPLFALMGHDFSGRDLVLIGGGLFLVAKATHEIHDRLEVAHPENSADAKGRSSLKLVLLQIIVLDLVFSLDSVITAVGMAQHVAIMVLAMFVAVVVMMIFAGKIGDFVNRHPSVKMLALAFLLLIGFMLVLDGMGKHVGKGYIYFAMAFSLGVEMLNLRARKSRDPVQLHGAYEATPPAARDTT